MSSDCYIDFYRMLNGKVPYNKVIPGRRMDPERVVPHLHTMRTLGEDYYAIERRWEPVRIGHLAILNYFSYDFWTDIQKLATRQKVFTPVVMRQLQSRAEKLGQTLVGDKEQQEAKYGPDLYLDWTDFPESETFAELREYLGCAWRTRVD